MTRAACPHADITALHAAMHPAELAREWHEQGGAVVSDEFGGFYALTAYAQVKRAAADAETFCSGDLRLGTASTAVRANTWHAAR